MQKEVTAADMMAARERRAERQKELLEQGGALISFTLNIPGPLKLSPLWERGFNEGCRLIEARLARKNGRSSSAADMLKPPVTRPSGCWTPRQTS